MNGTAAAHRGRRWLLAGAVLACWLPMGVSAPVGSNEADPKQSIVTGLAQRRQQLERVSGQLVSVTFYSDWAIERESKGATAKDLRRLHPDWDLTWARKGAVYCDFALHGERWRVRAMRLINSGFSEFYLPGYGEAAYKPEADLPGAELAQYEMCDGQNITGYDAERRRAEIAPADAPARYGQLLNAVRGRLVLTLYRAGIPLDEWLEERLPIAKVDNQGETWDLQYVVKGAAGPARATYSIVPDKGFCLTRYEDLSLFDPRGEWGLRDVVEVEELSEVAEGVWVPKRLVIHQFRYAPEAENGWFSTEVAELLSCDVSPVPERVFAGFGIPLGTFVYDLRPREDPEASGAYHEGHVDSWQEWAYAKKEPPAHDEAWDKAPGRQAYEELLRRAKAAMTDT